MTEYDIAKTEAISHLEVDWQFVKQMNLTANDGVSDTEYNTVCQLVYNHSGIFFRFVCQDDKINATMTQYNAPIYDEEVVELFFQQTEDPHKYLELEWNAIGGVFCGNIYNDLRGNTSIDFVETNELVSDIYAEDGGWSVVGFIPAALFEGMMCGEWRFNAYRIKRRENGDMILSAFSPTIVPRFHTPDRFALLRFLD